MIEANRLRERLAEVAPPALVGDRDFVDLFTVALLSRGHLLLYGLPGPAETTAVSAIARSLGLDVRRIHAFPDMAVPDRLGAGGPAGTDGQGPGSALPNVLLIDEINRAPPRAQSALVSAMDERADPSRGAPADPAQPFVTIATVNPIETDEVYGLPASHRDRFLFGIELRPLDREGGLALLERYDRDETLGAGEVEPVASPEDVLALQDSVTTVYANAAVKEYLLDIVGAVDGHPDVDYGTSTRALLLFLRAAKARAAVDGREYVIPDDVRAIASPLLAPRLVLTTEAEVGEVAAESVVSEAVEEVVPPGMEFEEGAMDLEAAEGPEDD